MELVKIDTGEKLADCPLWARKDLGLPQRTLTTGLEGRSSSSDY